MATKKRQCQRIVRVTKLFKEGVPLKSLVRWSVETSPVSHFFACAFGLDANRFGFDCKRLIGSLNSMMYLN